MPSILRLNYIILNEPNVENVQFVEIDRDSQTFANLRAKIAEDNALVPGQIEKIEKVSMLMDDESINEKLRDFAFNPNAKTWRPMQKLSAIIASDDPAPGDLHLIIRPSFISVNYLFPGLSSVVSCVKISYSENVKALLEAILTDLRSRGYNVPLEDYVVSKTSISIHADVPRITTAEGQMLQMPQGLSEVFCQVPDRKHVHVVVKPRFNESRGSQAAVPTTESARRFRFLQGRDAEAPSTGGHPKIFSRKQESATEILCNRPSSSTPPIPLTLLDPIFAQFLDDCENIRTNREINEFTLKLTDAMSQFYADEKKRSATLIGLFVQLGIEFHTFKIPGTAYEIDAGLTKGDFLCVCGEVKNEAANNQDDPYLQATLYYLEQTRKIAANFPSSVLPCLILLCVGPYLSFAGAVWNGRPNIQVLTPAIPLHLHHTDLKLRKTAARYIAAFKSAVNSLKDHYKQPYYQKPDDIIPVDHIFPYPVSFKRSTPESSTNFVYLSQVKPDKLIFRGEVCDTHEKICIKFARCYSPEVHRFCASIGCAPVLLGFEELLGGWFMVIMAELDNYVDLRGSLLTPGHLAEVKDTLREKLVAMHQHGFVHGDIRNVNVMVSKCSLLGVMLVDFDWAGKIGETTYPMNVNRESVRRPEDAIDDELILAEHDMRMLEELNTL